MATMTIRSSQKVFTEEEVSGLMGIGLDDLRNLARLKHLGSMEPAAQGRRQCGKVALHQL